MQLKIIIPTSNSSLFIGECLDSISLSLSSDFSLSASVIDNLSTDQTLSQLLSFRSRGVALEYVSQQDTGPAQALNTGFSMALGGDAEIVGWLNSDDYYSPGAIDRALAAFAADRKLKIVYGLGRHVDENGKALGAYPTLPPSTNIKQFAQGSFICQPTVFLRKEVFAEVGLLDEYLKTAFDLDLWLRIFKRYRKNQIGFVNKVQAYSRLHDQCITKRMRQTVAIESMQVIARHLGSAPGHWILTYFDEMCERYPFIDEKESLVEIMKGVLEKARPFMKAVDFKTLVQTLQADHRLRLSSPSAFVGVQTDGWVSKRLIVKLRYQKGGKRTLRLICKGGWPEAVNLNLKIRSMAGEVEQVKLGSQDEFVLTLEAPETLTEAFAAWVIETRQSFTPSSFNKRSKDHRALSFVVQGLELV
jgi:glycosyltransferase involved in cell wall biosynthesis